MVEEGIHTRGRRKFLGGGGEWVGILAVVGHVLKGKRFFSLAVGWLVRACRIHFAIFCSRTEADR